MLVIKFFYNNRFITDPKTIEDLEISNEKVFKYVYHKIQGGVILEKDVFFDEYMSNEIDDKIDISSSHWNLFKEFISTSLFEKNLDDIWKIIDNKSCFSENPLLFLLATNDYDDVVFPENFIQISHWIKNNDYLIQIIEDEIDNLRNSSFLQSSKLKAYIKGLKILKAFKAFDKPNAWLIIG